MDSLFHIVKHSSSGDFHSLKFPEMVKHAMHQNMKRDAQYPNNLAKLRKTKRLVQRDIARVWNCDTPLVSRIESGAVGITQDKLLALHKAFGWTPSQIYGTEELTKKIPVLYKIGAGARVNPVDDHEPGAALDYVDLPPGVDYSENLCAFRVEGDSQAPMLFDGWFVFSRTKVLGGCFDVTSKSPHIVKIKDGETMLKLVRRGYTQGKYNLRSYNGDDIDDVEIDWSAKIEAIVPK